MPSGVYYRSKRVLVPDKAEPIVWVPLGRAGVDGWAVVDIRFMREVGAYNWSLRKPTKRCNTSYAITHEPVPGYPTLFLHRLIGRQIGMPEELEIDHRDGDGLNNRETNLRKANGSQNRGNTGKQKNSTSGFKGVHLRKDSGKYVAGIVSAETHRRKHLGTFDTAEEAAKAYDRAAVAHFGPFAVLNFPET
jgi:hypothetical protein